MKGYVLWEVVLGGALIAIIMGTLLTSLAEGRVKNAVAGRDVVAAQLVQEKIEEARARGKGVTPTACAGTAVTVANQQGSYSRTCTVTAGGSNTVTTGAGALTVTFDTVTVSVSYRPATGVRTVAASVRRYRP